MNEELVQLLAKELDILIVLSRDQVMSLVFHLCKLYAIEIMASHHNYPAVVSELGVGLTVCAPSTIVLTAAVADAT